MRNRINRNIDAIYATYILVLCLCSVPLSGTTEASEAEPAHEMLDAVLWASTSAEHYAVSMQSYRLATEKLQLALRDPLWTAALEQESQDYSSLPPAVILDLDETVFDNVRYESQIIRNNAQYTEASFKTWVDMADAGAMPGVKDFILFASKQGVEIFYTSLRLATYRGATARNIHKLGLPLADETTNLLLADIGATGAKRALVAKTHRILLVCGDNLDDFADLSRQSPEKRKEAAVALRQWWGNRWIVLPNAMYGHWEASMYGFQYGLEHSKKLALKRGFLPN